jgi:cytosine/adenosine deaminase-related metal-dependent hydrolase
MDGRPNAPDLLLHDAAVVVTMDPERRELAGGSVLTVAGRIAAVGPRETLEAEWVARRVGGRAHARLRRIDASRGCSPRTTTSSSR